MYIRLWDHMHMRTGRRIHVSMYISKMTNHFRKATELWSMYVLMGSMSGRVTLSGPFVGTLPSLQPLKLSFEVQYKLVTACHLILQGGQVFPLGLGLICKAIRIAGGRGRGSRGAELVSQSRSLLG